jgi:UrcA family protein
MKNDTYTPRRFAIRTAVLALLAIGAEPWSSAPAAPPTASPPLTQTSLIVKLNDLDLSTDQGVRLAYERIRAAAKQACTFTTHMGDYVVGSREVYAHCYSTTMANAIKQVNRTQLAALHEQESRIGGY